MDAMPKKPVPMPWQSSQWQRLRELQSTDRLPHAILLCGSPGTGKLQFAHALANFLLCASPVEGLPCHQCRTCLLVEAGTHPDLRCLQPEEEGKRIKVDQVRTLVDFLGRTAQQGGYKVALVSPAESMNPNAANALLKSLEEPSSSTLILLVADSPARLLPTIRSRCQAVVMPMPSAKQSLEWLGRVLSKPEEAERLLADCSGQPLSALKLLESGGLERSQQLDKGFYELQLGRSPAVAMADRWLEYELADILRWLLRRTHDLIRHLQAGAPLEAPWSLFGKTNCMDLFGFSDSLSILLVKVDQGAVPNRQLVLEDLLLQSCDIFHIQ